MLFRSLHVLGNVSLQLTGYAVITLNGPWRFGASFAFGCVVWILVPSSHTKSPSLNLYSGPSGQECFIVSTALRSAAATSVRRHSRDFSRSSTVGFLVSNWSGGINVGEKPYQTLNGDFLVALWDLALWANSMNGMRSAQLSCWKLQKIRRYCSSSWFTRSVLPSVWGWYAVLRADFMLSFLHNSWMTLDANCGP